MVKMLVGIAAIMTLEAQDALGQGSAGAWGFANVRYDTRSSASMYTGYGWRHAFAMGGVQQNPRTGYSELLGGAGASFRTGAAADHWLVLASARSGRVSLAQLYWLPTLRTGAVTTRAQVKWSVPYKGSAAQKLTISPLSLTLPVGRRLAGGVAVEMAAAEGASTTIATGLQLRIRLPRAGVGVDALRDVTGNASRVRCFFSSLF